MNLNNKNNNHENCGFAEFAAAYIYGEIEYRDKAKFETHLSKCDSCAEEIAGFTMLRSGIADWKMKSFDALETPLIEIPYEQIVEIKAETVSWIDSLKTLLTFSRSMATVAAAIVLALFAGLGFMIFNANVEEVASDKVEKIQSVPPVIENKDYALPAPDVAETKMDLPEVKTVDTDISTPQVPKTKVKVLEKPQSIATKKTNKIKEIKPKQKSVDLNTIVESSPVQAQKLPKLNTLPDEEEVNELSLSDLLADVDAK